MTAVATYTRARRAARPSLIYLLGVTTLVFASALLCLTFSWNGTRIAGIWIGNAFLLAPLLQHRRRDWFSLLAAGYVANFCADIVIGDPIARAAATPLINVAEVLLVALPMRYFRLDRDFTRTQSLIPFYLLAGGPAPLIAAVLAAFYFEAVEHGHFWASVWIWYAGDALGLIMLVPPLLTVKGKDISEMFGRGQRLESLALIGLLLGIVSLNFVQDYPTAFLFFPCVLLLTFRRGFAGGSIGLLIVALYMVAPILLGDSSGALKPHSLREQVTIVQIFVAVMGFSVVLVGAALEERRKLEQWLASAIARAENSREEALVAKDAAEKANRSKSMFLANMSHELRTPLNAVIGFSEMMHTEVFGPLGDKRYREYTDLIRGAGQHLLDLINDILDMSKIEAGKQELHREKLNVADLGHEALHLMREQAATGHVRLEMNTGTAPVFVMADRRAMKQILLNLLSNAVKFTPEGGQVTVNTTQTGDHVTLSVRDTGIGIPAEQIYRLGNPFIQIRNNAGTTQTGTGLGLALVRALTEMHDGTFRIESIEGQGTTVTIMLPACLREPLAA
ncbi:MAG TPA: ATP-binding protein [Rhizomicrobium sp.]